MGIAMWVIWSKRNKKRCNQIRRRCELCMSIKLETRTRDDHEQCIEVLETKAKRFLASLMLKPANRERERERRYAKNSKQRVKQ